MTVDGVGRAGVGVGVPPVGPRSSGGRHHLLQG